MDIFEPALMGGIRLKNRVIRSATIMKLCNKDGFPLKEYHRYYYNLAKNGPGLIITGFTYISKQGRSMHTGQAGMDAEVKGDAFKKTTRAVHSCGCPIIMQLAHTGRQTKRKATGKKVCGVSKKKSFYFNEVPAVLTTKEAASIAGEFARSAYFAKLAGFDGIQLHAAHGYLIHQFILPHINNRKDRFGIDSNTQIGTGFLDETIDRIREKCGSGFPILVKVSAGDDYDPPFNTSRFINLIRFLHKKKVAAIEISYGTMDYALNMFRGASIPYNTILRYNPKYKIKNRTLRYLWKIFARYYLAKKMLPFTPMYNAPYAEIAKDYTDIPVICVGGFRTGEEIRNTVQQGKSDFISLSRPLLCEPDFILKIREDHHYTSKCVNCNTCAVMVDSPFPTRCYTNKRQGGIS